jgi:hypothetical protein
MVELMLTLETQRHERDTAALQTLHIGITGHAFECITRQEDVSIAFIVSFGCPSKKQQNQKKTTEKQPENKQKDFHGRAQSYQATLTPQSPFPQAPSPSPSPPSPPQGPSPRTPPQGPSPRTPPRARAPQTAPRTRRSRARPPCRCPRA